LLSPCSRSRNCSGSSAKANGRGDEAKRSKPHRAGERRPLDHKEPAHRVAQLGLHHQPAQPCRKAADRDPRFVPLADPALRHVTAGDHDIEAIGFYFVEHTRQQSLVVLEVAVHHRKVRRGGRQHAFDASRAEPAPADALNAAYVALRQRQLADRVGGAVRRIIVDEDHFPGDARKDAVQPLDDQRNIVSLVQRRDDDSEFNGRGVTLHRRLGLQRRDGSFRPQLGDAHAFDPQQEAAGATRLDPENLAADGK
jgi:hypothetical protein